MSARHQASPRARRQARLAGIRLETVIGSGPAGRIIAADVLRASQAGEPKDTRLSGRTPRGVPAQGFRTLIAEFDLTPSAAGGDPLANVASIVAAVADGLRSHPALAADRRSGREIDLEVAIAAGDDPRTVVIRDAGALNITGIRHRLDLGASDEAGTFRVACADDAGPLLDWACPPPGQRAALRVGAPADRVVVANTGEWPGISIRRIAYAALTYAEADVEETEANGFLRRITRHLSRRTVAGNRSDHAPHPL